MALDIRTGKEIGDRRPTTAVKRVKALSKGITKNWAYGGLILAGNQIIVVHGNGVVKAIPADDKAASAVFNALPDDIHAQPTCDGPALYLRSVNFLYRFDNPDPGK